MKLYTVIGYNIESDTVVTQYIEAEDGHAAMRALGGITYAGVLVPICAIVGKMPERHLDTIEDEGHITFSDTPYGGAA